MSWRGLDSAKLVEERRANELEAQRIGADMAWLRIMEGDSTDGTWFMLCLLQMTLAVYACGVLGLRDDPVRLVLDIADLPSGSLRVHEGMFYQTSRRVRARSAEERRVYLFAAAMLRKIRRTRPKHVRIL